jgi:VWFA-related protein
MRALVRSAYAGALLAGLSVSTAARPQQPPQPPVFRAGAHYVRVDAYPTRDGKIIEGLTADDFAVFEDGKPQQIAAVELVPYDAPPDDDRDSIMSARQGLELAANPHYRVFVFVIDRAAFDDERWREMREALHAFFQSDVGPRDLVGLVTTDRSWSDLVIGRRIAAIEQEIDEPDWLRAEPQEMTAALTGCGVEGLRGRIRAEETYSLLEGVVRLLGQIREDRTSIVFISSGLSRQGPDRRLAEQRTLQMPAKIGLVNGKIQRVPRATAMHDSFCSSERVRLAEQDFSRRYDALVTSARASNVAFYPVAIPLLLPPRMPGGRAGFEFASMPRSSLLPDTLVGLAGGTDGFVVSADKDARGGLARVVNDAAPHYLLGYYTTNTKWDGRVRSIKITLKKTGAPIRGRRYYRAPTNKEIAKLSARRAAGLAGPPPEIAAALDPLSRLRRSTQFFTYGVVARQTLTVVVEVPSAAVQAGRWKNGAALDVLAETADGKTVATSRGQLTPNGRAVLRIPIAGPDRPATVSVRLRSEGESLVQRTEVEPRISLLVGDPLAYRSGPRGLAVPVALFEFEREERMKLDWPALAKLDRIDARMLDRNGHPLRYRVGIEQRDTADGPHLVSNLSLASLGRGDYVIELEVAAGAQVERKLIAFRIR